MPDTTPTSNTSTGTIFEIGLDDGRTLHIDASDQDAALAGAQHFLAQEQAQRPDTDIIGAAQRGLADTARGFGATAADYLGSKTVKDYADRFATAVDDPNYQSTPVVQNGTVNASAIPSAVAESIPAAAPALGAGYALARVLSKLPGWQSKFAGAAAGGLTYWLEGAGNNAEATAAARTGDPNAQPTTGDLVRGGLTTAAQAGANEALAGVPFLPGVMKATASGAKGLSSALGKLGIRAAGGAGAGAATDAIGQLGTTGAVDPSQVEASAVTGGVTAGTIGAYGTTKDATDAVKYRGITPDLEPAATRFADLMAQNAQGRNINRVVTGHDAFTRAASQANDALDAAVSSAGPLTPEARTVIKAVNDGQTVSPQDYQTVQNAAGNGPAGQELIDRLQDVQVSHVVRNSGTLTDRKFVGGTLPAVSRMTGLSGHGTVRSLVTAGLAEQLGSEIFHQSPEAIAAMTGLTALATAKDWISGNRYPAARFINRYGTPAPGVASAAQQPAAPMTPPAAATVAPSAGAGPATTPQNPAPSLLQTLQRRGVPGIPTVNAPTPPDTAVPAAPGAGPAPAIPAELQPLLQALAAQSKVDQTADARRSFPVKLAPHRPIGPWGKWVGGGGYRPR